MIRNTLLALVITTAALCLTPQADAGDYANPRVYSSATAYFGAHPPTYNSYSYYPHARYYGYSNYANYGSYGNPFYFTGYRPYWNYAPGYVYPYNFTYYGWPYSAVFYRPVYPHTTLMPVSQFGWGYGGGSMWW